MMTVIIGTASVRQAVRRQKEALEHRLQEFTLELLAAIVLIAIFIVVTEPEAPADAGAQSAHQSDRWLILGDFARSCRACAALARRHYQDLRLHWTKTQGILDAATKSFRASSAILHSSTPH
jgi:hypothetical protein